MLRRLACLVVIWLAAGGAIADTAARLEKDLADLAAMMAGRWDNDRQVFFAGDDEAALPDRHHWHLKLDAEGEPGVLIGEHQREGGAVHQVRHVLTPDAQRNAIRHEMRAPDGAPGPDCVLFWRRTSGGFRAEGEGADCARIAPGPGEGDYLLVHALSSDEYWVEAGRGGSLARTELRRARPFTCWAAILRGTTHGDSGEGLSDWDFRRGVILHDQGGEAELITDESPPRTIRLRLRDVDWPYGTRRPSLTLYVLEGESDRPVSYAWTEGGGERIGLNLRWMQASCTHTPDEP